MGEKETKISGEDLFGGSIEDLIVLYKYRVEIGWCRLEHPLNSRPAFVAVKKRYSTSRCVMKKTLQKTFVRLQVFEMQMNNLSQANKQK
jgi:hypothetical protein